MGGKEAGAAATEGEADVLAEWPEGACAALKDATSAESDSTLATKPAAHAGGDASSNIGRPSLVPDDRGDRDLCLVTWDRVWGRSLGWAL